MMKKFFKFTVLLLGMLIVMPMTADAQKKDKKEKKEKKKYEWKWDGVKSGNADIDAYLVGVDTLWRNMQNMHEQWEMYQLKDTVIQRNGKFYVMSHMEDSHGNLVTRGTVNWQLANTIATCTNIVANSTLIGLQTATASLSLPQLGLKALSYAKYVKGGPNVIALSAKEMKAIWGIAVAQAKRWNSMKKDAIDIDEFGLDLTDKQKQNFRKCFYIKELKEADPEYQVVKEQLSLKPTDQLESEGINYVNDVASKEIIPEDKSKSVDELNEDDMKQFEG